MKGDPHLVESHHLAAQGRLAGLRIPVKQVSKCHGLFRFSGTRWESNQLWANACFQVIECDFAGIHGDGYDATATQFGRFPERRCGKATSPTPE